MSTGSSPPAQPPMMSPDGKWVWDGQKWIPVAVHDSVFPAYGDATAAAAAGPVAETMVEPPVNPFAGPPSSSPFVGPDSATPFAGPPSASPFPSVAVASAPAVVSPPIVQPPSYTGGGATPPWQAWASGGRERSRMLYYGAAFIAVAIGVILVIYFGLSQLPFLRASNGTPTPSASPVATPTPQLAARSDFAIAQRYVKSTFGPDMALLNQPRINVREACNGVLSVSCQQALTGLDGTLPQALAAFNDPPLPCIAKSVAKVRNEVLAMQTAVKTMLKSYSDNNRSELQKALSQYFAVNKSLNADIATVSSIQSSYCDGQAEGP